MKKIITKIFLIVSLILFGWSNNADAQLSKFEKWNAPSFFRGFNIMDENYIGNSYSRIAADFVALKNTGANFVQIGTAGFDSITFPYNSVPLVISRLDSMVAFAKNAGLYYTIAVRSGPGRFDVADEAIDTVKFKSTIWTNNDQQKIYAKMLKTMAQRYSADTLFAGLNLMVEPTPLYGKYEYPALLDSALKATGIDMKMMFKTFIDSVRKADLYLPLIVQAVNWSDPGFFGILKKQSDTNIVYDFHCYTPFEYSHDTVKNHVSYPGTFPTGFTSAFYNKSFIDTAVLKLVKNFKLMNNVPVFMGEFGIRWQQNGGEKYLTDLADIVIANGWSFAIWAFASRSTFDYDSLRNSIGQPYMNTVKTFFKSNVQTTAWTRANTLQKGMNMSAWLEADWLLPSNNYPDTFKYTQKHFIFLKNLGYKTIRLPVMFELLADTLPPYNLHTSHITYSLVDSVIKWTQSIGLNLIIDNHPDPNGGSFALTNANFLTQLPRLCGVWKHLAQKYQSLNPNTTFFEIRNEPNNAISTANWRVVANAIIDTIRHYDTEHTIITGAAFWNDGDSLFNLVPFTDKNIIYTFHNYKPGSFTFQGQPSYPTGVTFPLAGDVDRMRRDFIHAKNWSLVNNLPLLLGETGCVNRYFADAASRCNWATSTAFFTDSLNIPLAYWDGFRVQQPDPNNFGFMSLTSLIPDSVEICFASAFHLNTIVTAVNGNSGNIPTEFILYQNYPNPFNSTTTIKFKVSEFGFVSLKIFDVLGRDIATLIEKKLNAGEYTVVFNAMQLSNGFYFCRLQTGKFIDQKKMIVLK